MTWLVEPEEEVNENNTQPVDFWASLLKVIVMVGGACYAEGALCKNLCLGNATPQT
ncbi:MAG: hypothetical protein AB1746_14000 [Candidatus Zixiibacteriota bacterium]